MILEENRDYAFLIKNKEEFNYIKQIAFNQVEYFNESSDNFKENFTNLTKTLLNFIGKEKYLCVFINSDGRVGWATVDKNINPNKHYGLNSSNGGYNIVDMTLLMRKQKLKKINEL